jgi:hypothetical protein
MTIYAIAGCYLVLSKYEFIEIILCACLEGEGANSHKPLKNKAL